MANKIFFSYSRKDGENFALKLAGDLRKEGLNVWIDRIDIRPGAIWDTEVEKALTSSDCLIFIATAQSSVAKNVLDEVYYALEENKEVIPVIYGDCKIPYRLSRLQHIDFNHDYKTAFNELLNALRTINSPEPQTEASLWESANKKNTRSGFEEYLHIFPNGKYKQDAYKRIEEFNPSPLPPQHTKLRISKTVVWSLSLIAIILLSYFLFFNKKNAGATDLSSNQTNNSDTNQSLNSSTNARTTEEKSSMDQPAENNLKLTETKQEKSPASAQYPKTDKDGASGTDGAAIQSDQKESDNIKSKKKLPSENNIHIHAATIYFPGGGQKNNNSAIGDFCCTGETATVYSDEKVPVGYIYFYDFPGGGINISDNQSGATNFRLMVSGITDIGNSQSGREKKNIDFTSDELYYGANKSIKAGALYFSVTVQSVEKYSDPRYYLMSSIRIKVDVSPA